MGIVMPHLNMKVCRMIPGPRHATANGATASAKTYGTGKNTTGLGIVDRQGWDWAVIIASRDITKSGASTTWTFYHQSGSATLTASATAITSAVHSSVLGASGTFHVYRINLENKKRYLNAKIRTCVTSGSPEAFCLLFSGAQFPVSHGSLATVRNL